MTNRPPDSPWLTKREAAERARVSMRVLDRATASGELRSRQLGRRILFHIDWVDAWLSIEQAS